MSTTVDEFSIIMSMNVTTKATLKKNTDDEKSNTALFTSTLAPSAVEAQSHFREVQNPKSCEEPQDDEELPNEQPVNKRINSFLDSKLLLIERENSEDDAAIM